MKRIILILFLIILVSGCGGNKCETNEDCITKICFTSECKDNKCIYSPVSGCCGNEKCETGETYESCAGDCPNCDDANDCTKDSYDYHEQKCVYKSSGPCYLKPITIAPATSVTDYQIKIILTSSNFAYSKAMKNGEDIRFFDEGGNSLNYWIEDWNGPGGISSIWVKVTSSGTDKIYMYYGHPDTSSASSAASVFEFFDNFDYSDESELTEVWTKHGDPDIELSNGVVTIATSGDGKEGAQHIFKDVGSSTLLSNIVEIYAKRFSGGYGNHMANIGYASSTGGPIGDGNCWAVSRYNPSPDGGIVVFGSNHGSIVPSPYDSFNIIKIYLFTQF